MAEAGTVKSRKCDIHMSSMEYGRSGSMTSLPYPTPNTHTYLTGGRFLSVLSIGLLLLSLHLCPGPAS